MEQTDVFVVGGGINGAAIAADAAGRGLSVTLCDKADLASGTSSASTKLIHGGLRYLDHYEFGLVRQALKEREILLRRAPHLIAPLEFVLPHASHLRPAWMIRAGLFLYDHLAKRSTIPGSKTLNLRNDERGFALRFDYHKGFSYYDCLTDDARLTIANALSAKKHHALILPYHEFIAAEREQNHWLIKIENTTTHEVSFCHAHVLINAAGPWVNQIQQRAKQNIFDVKLVKGSHIVVPKMYDGDFAYILQNQDGRVVFAIPYQENFTLVGTTDVLVQDDVDHVAISENEISYLCDSVNQFFKKSISASNIIWSYSGVRCLQADGEKNLTKLSREHKIALDQKNNLVTVLGGKITTHRLLAEETVNKLAVFFPKLAPAWTANAALPGGNLAEQNFQKFLNAFMQYFSWLPAALAHYYAKNYGTLAYQILENCRSVNDLGTKFTNLLYQKEVEYLVKYEWAKTADDILWRRTKQGLNCSQHEKLKLLTWLASRR